MERDFLVRLKPKSFFLGMSYVASEGRWLWSDDSEVTWTNWHLLPKGAHESPANERNCAVMRRVRGGNDGDELSGLGWDDEGCGSMDIKSLICQRRKAR